MDVSFFKNKFYLLYHGDQLTLLTAVLICLTKLFVFKDMQLCLSKNAYNSLVNGLWIIIFRNGRSGVMPIGD